MATKITNKLISLPQDISIDRVVNHPHSIEIFIFSPDPTAYEQSTAPMNTAAASTHTL